MGLLWVFILECMLLYRWKKFKLALIVPYIIHGSYNFLVSFPNYYYLGVLLIALIFSIFYRNKEDLKNQTKNMKKKLFSPIFFTFTSNVLASTYWSNVPDGPRTIQEAIDKLDGKMLDPIEGVWFTDGMGTVAIFNSDKDTFKMYIIDGDGSAKLFNRTWEATYIKSGSHYNFFHRVWYTNYDGSINRVRTQSGKAYLGSNKNNYSTKYYKKSEEGLLMDGFYTRKSGQSDIFTRNSTICTKI